MSYNIQISFLENGNQYFSVTTDTKRTMPCDAALDAINDLINVLAFANYKFGSENIELLKRKVEDLR